MIYPIRERHYHSPALHSPRTGGLALPIAQPKVLRHRASAELRPSGRLHPGGAGVRPMTPRMVSTSEGTIDRLLMAIPSYAALYYAETYKQLFMSLPERVNFVLAVHDSARPKVADWLQHTGISDRTEVVGVPDHLAFSVWAEDAYAATAEAGGRTFLVEPYGFDRYADSFVADHVSGRTDLAMATAPVYFQGGNILVGDDFILIGGDYPRKSLDFVGNQIVPREGESPHAVVNRLYREYLDSHRTLTYVETASEQPIEKEVEFQLNGQTWTEIRHWGNAKGTRQPIFHLDMFITPAGLSESGSYRLLVGDPAAAAHLIGMELPDHALQEAFDEIAGSLSKLDYEVVRNPLPLVYFDNRQDRLRTWYYATSNNLLVQNATGEERRVWMPTYGHGSWKALTCTDNANAAIWKYLGYEVIPVGDFHPFASNRGSLHCITKYLARGT